MGVAPSTFSPSRAARTPPGGRGAGRGTAPPIQLVRTRENPRPVTIFLKMLHHSGQGSALREGLKFRDYLRNWSAQFENDVQIAVI